MRAGWFLLALLALAAAPAPAEAQSELGFTHPAELCIEQRADAVLGGPMADYLVARLTGAANLPNPSDSFEVIAQECVRRHGVPPTSDRIVGKLVSAKAMRDEALRRLATRGPDMSAWVIDNVGKAHRDAGDDIVRVRDEVLSLMRAPPPVGQSIDVADGSEEGRVIGVLVVIYVSGVLQLAQARTEAAR